MATVTVIRNDEESGPGQLPQWAADAGVGLDLVTADSGAAIPERARELDGLILLGGGFLPDADDRAPWLAQERRLARECLQDGVPVLGICLGAQLLALVGGGRVEGSFGRPEKGVTALRPQPAAADDVLFAALEAPTIGVESHRDQITQLPPEASLLMSSERCPIQAFRLGEAAWATQWHPEASGQRVTTWNDGELEKLGFDPLAVKQEARERAADLERIWSAFVRRFFAVVAQRAG